MAEKLISKIPEGPLSEKWTKHKSQIRVVINLRSVLSILATRGNSKSLSSGPDSEEHQQLLRWVSSVIT